MKSANMNKIRASLSQKIQSAGRLHEITYNFSILESDELRVLTVLRIMEMFETLPQAKCKMKDTQESTDLRKKANKIFVDNKEPLKAWEMYSKSIAMATKDSQELSLAYANRSAILIKVRKYAECVDDIERALQLDYPDHLRGKLMLRKIECLKILNKVDLLNDTLDQIRKWLDCTSLCSNDKQNFERKLKDTKNHENCVEFKFTKSEDNPITIVPNKLIRCASEALTVKTSEQFGRHVVATRDIKPGEIIVVEKPYSKILSLDEAYTHCSHCLQVHWAMIPCEFCVYAMYCSEECKREAWLKCHEIECAITGYLVDLGFGKQELFSARLAIVAMRDVGCVKALRESLKGKDALSSGELYLSESYANVYNLVTSSEKRSVADLFDRSLNAAFILYYLCTMTSLLDEKFTDVKDIQNSLDAIFIGGLVLRHMQIIPCNIHSYEEERRIDIVDIGAAALPFCSLINHSCDPNVSRCTTSNNMIVFALVTIQCGSQIYDNYGSHYAVMRREERREKLAQYYFDCNCQACKRDWPLYQCLPSYTELLKDKERIGKIEKIVDKLDTYVQQAKDDRIDDKLGMMSELAMMIDTLTRLLTLPCREVNNAVETLKRVVTLTYGNKFQLPKLL